MKQIVWKTLTSNSLTTINGYINNKIVYKILFKTRMSATLFNINNNELINIKTGSIEE